MHFKKLPLNLKPREKAKIYGINELTDIELLAIFIRSGTSKSDVLELSKNIIAKFGSLQNIKHSTFSELSNIYGIGSVKALEILSLIEFSKRLKSLNIQKLIYDQDAANIALEMIEKNNKESFVIILLDIKNNVIHKEVLYKGTNSEVNIDPKDIISIALRKNSNKFYCIHNHPSGDKRPSDADILITRRLKHYCNLFSIKMLGHLIIDEKGRFNKVS